MRQKINFPATAKSSSVKWKADKEKWTSIWNVYEVKKKQSSNM